MSDQPFHDITVVAELKRDDLPADDLGFLRPFHDITVVAELKLSIRR